MHFHVIYHKDNFEMMTDENGIVICEDVELTKEALLNLLKISVKVKRDKYGFHIFWDDRKQLKSVYTRSAALNHINTTTKNKQTAKEQIEMIFNADEQLKLF